ncbi:amino acid/amide ABC transporter ATP-binding protein 2 (HAAT family) [Maritalea mobilis]|uniref:Amino acid/amide ABC transporter ATP-binding protein 2 (HAAT family) n=1 Tax=Maritalea mobilis TaxID=483324 RepID=A0A4R6VTP8_9HYPH|nr:ABC transporter ATP-binding protein [Maritalea mobilis]TDQ66056.1 amino acid/amide ABC transporter ATP-binding protein 2 (HAAT family) [Maritalea mobilis]
MSNKILDVQNLTAGYGKQAIIENINTNVSDQQIVVIVGPNGAGKSTLLKSVFGLNNRMDGDITFHGQSIFTAKTSELVPMGISAVPQSHNVFPTLTVEENLDVGTFAAPPQDKKATKSKILDLFPDLKDKLGQQAGELSGGQRQMVAVGRALMSEPKLILLDEPTAGLSPAYLEVIFDLLLQVRDSGVAILMVEQNAKQALRIADYAYVLVNGKNAYEGTGAKLLQDDEVRKSFLGGGAPQ